MRVYYRGRDALVTDKQFVWRADSPRAFEVGNLRNVVLVRSKSSNSPGLTPSVLIGVSVLVLSVTTAVLVRGTTAWVVSALASLAALGYSWRAVRSRPRYLEIRARYNGVDTVVYSNQDDRAFHQVARALRRAIESNLSPRPNFGERIDEGRNGMDQGVA